MKRALYWVLSVLAAATCQWHAQAAGFIIIHDQDFWRQPPRLVPIPPPPHPPPRPIPPPRPRPPRPPVWAPLEVAFVRADVKIQDQVARTFIEQEFYNPNARRLEGTFLFPVPKGAHLDKFTLDINGKPVEAELLKADKARDIYENIVRKLRDPALLEYAGRDLFKARIFPIEPHSKKRITLAYTHLMKSDAGLLNYVLPLNTEKYSAKPLRAVSVKVSIDSKRPLKSIYSPSHRIEVKRKDEHHALVGFEASHLKPDTDFQLFYTQEEGEFGLSLLTFKETGEPGYFLLLASPGAESRSTKIIPKDVVFVLDTSGSMAGAKLDQAKKALQFCVANLNAADRFEVLRFSTETEPLFDRLAEATKDNGDRAAAFIRKLKPIGGTAIDEALRKALALRPENKDRPYVIIFLTDGRPTVGNTDENQIVAHVTGNARELTRIFCFGIGTDVNTHLLDRITEDTHAFSQYVLPEEDIEIKVSSFFTRIKEPVLAGPKITFPEGVRITKMYPAPVPDLFKGEQLVLAGRFTGSGSGRIGIAGSVAGEERRFSYAAAFPERATEHDFIPRLWATRRVGYLLDEIRLRGESGELKDEVTQLARQYGIVTPYTAYLIVEDEGRRGLARREQTLQFGSSVQVRRQLAESYDSFARDRSGEAAVGGARSTYRLKSAQAPALAITEGRNEALRKMPYAWPVPAQPQADGAVGANRQPYRTATPSVVSEAAAAKANSRAVSPRSHYVGGRTFYLNENVWIDSEIQQAKAAKRVRIQFGSADYFALLKKHPQALPWLALGRNLQFVLQGTIYEIVDTEPAGPGGP